ncbi:MAG: hypothetical protein A2Y63_06575 [Candidatus Riflebacteria bacterium RBG_13_59_9]|nr:MAG: hypothetical protein A2Y63_06575 [Candidatus Riflebacteria bacterium RBG_13_59_9]
MTQGLLRGDPANDIQLPHELLDEELDVAPPLGPLGMEPLFPFGEQVDHQVADEVDSADERLGEGHQARELLETLHGQPADEKPHPLSELLPMRRGKLCADQPFAAGPPALPIGCQGSPELPFLEPGLLLKDLFAQLLRPSLAVPPPRWLGELLPGFCLRDPGCCSRCRSFIVVHAQLLS